MNDKAPDWGEIYNDYISTKITQSALARKYGVSSSAISRRCRAEDWPAARKARRQEPAREDGRKPARPAVLTEADVERLQLSVRAEIFRQLLSRMTDEHPDTQDFRRLVQSYADMMDIHPPAADQHSDAFEDLLHAIRPDPPDGTGGQRKSDRKGGEEL